MTNKPMLSVELKLNDRQECDLIRFNETCEDSQPYDVSKEWMKSLARIGLVRSLGFSRYELTDVGSATVYKLLEFLRNKPAAQHQGEPVAWVTQCLISGLIEQAEPNEKTTNLQCWSDAFPVFREQPAPVAVVMPDVDELAQIIRKFNGSHTLGAGSLAEAILEEVARLNGVKT